MVLQRRGEENDISIREAICEIKFIISSEDEIEIEAFSCGTAKIADKTGVGFMANFTA